MRIYWSSFLKKSLFDILKRLFLSTNKQEAHGPIAKRSPEFLPQLYTNMLIGWGSRPFASYDPGTKSPGVVTDSGANPASPVTQYIWL